MSQIEYTPSGGTYATYMRIIGNHITDPLAEWEWSLLYGPTGVTTGVTLIATVPGEEIEFHNVTIDTWKIEGQFLVFESGDTIHYVPNVLHFRTI